MTKKANTSLIILVIALIVVVIGLIIYFALKASYLNQELENQPTFAPTTTSIPSSSSLSDRITKTFITTTTAANGDPEDIGLASFAFDQEPLIAAAKIDTNMSNSNFEARWSYLDGEKNDFYIEMPTRTVSGDYLTSSLKFNQLDSQMKQFQQIENTFPIGNYQIDWYITGQKVATTDFAVSGQ